jgi:hypothetical protein
MEPIEAAVEKKAYDFYRCYECKRMFTRLEELRDVFTRGTACACGSRKYIPTAYRWYFRFLPRVLSYWFRVRKYVSGPDEITRPLLVERGLM